MRFLGNIALSVSGEVVRREVGFWERFKKVFSRTREADRRDAQALMTTAHLLSGVKRVLDGLGITNAVRLVIDGKVLFEDKSGRTDDVGELFAAFYENEELYGQSFRELLLVVEHRDGGLAKVMALKARGDGMSDEARVDVVVSVRVDGLDRGDLLESGALASRFSTPVQAEAYRLQFERFLAKVAEALAGAMPEVQVSSPVSATRLVRPGVVGGPPRAPWNDPWATVHDEQPGEVEAALWELAMGWAWHPDYTVIDRDGALIGPLPAQVPRTAAEVSAQDHLGDGRESPPKWDEDTFRADDDQGP